MVRITAFVLKWLLDLHGPTSFPLIVVPSQAPDTHTQRKHAPAHAHAPNATTAQTYLCHIPSGSTTVLSFAWEGLVGRRRFTA